MRKISINANKKNKLFGGILTYCLGRDQGSNGVSRTAPRIL